MTPVTSNADDGDVQNLTPQQMIAEYQAIEQDWDADDDPDGRAQRLDLLAEEFLRRRSDTPDFWYDRGMYAKWRSDWAASAEYNRKALDLIPAEERQGEPAAWNLGIAATALNDWATAREAWTAFGIPLPPAEKPDEVIVADFGPAPVRLNPSPRFIGQVAAAGETEVVWGQRLCPTRIQILNVPTPESGRRCGDVVLHDGDPVGTRMLQGREISVFNELMLFERSPLPTLSAEVRASGTEEVEALIEEIEQTPGFAAEDWTQNLQILCAACSEAQRWRATITARTRSGRPNAPWGSRATWSRSGS